MTVDVSGKATMPEEALISMIVMTFAMWAYTFAVSFMRVRNEILEKEKNSSWVGELMGSKK
jgi:heme exporter protein C